MFSKFQKASDKARIFLQHRVNSCVFLRHLSMSKKSSKVQALYDLCNQTFTPSASGTPPPSSQAVQSLSSLLGICQFFFSFFLQLHQYALILHVVFQLFPSKFANFDSTMDMGIANYVNSFNSLQSFDCEIGELKLRLILEIDFMHLDF
jgi:hypothetical protein